MALAGLPAERGLLVSGEARPPNVRQPSGIRGRSLVAQRSSTLDQTPPICGAGELQAGRPARGRRLHPVLSIAQRALVRSYTRPLRVAVSLPESTSSVSFRRTVRLLCSLWGGAGSLIIIGERGRPIGDAWLKVLRAHDPDLANRRDLGPSDPWRRARPRLLSRFPESSRPVPLLDCTSQRRPRA